MHARESTAPRGAQVCDLPIHFHTHCTSSASLAVALEMSRAGCDIIDFAIASMADLTSQPSLNAFCAAMAGDERDPVGARSAGCASLSTRAGHGRGRALRRVSTI